MPYQSIDRDNVHEYEKTKRAQIICSTVVSGIFLLSCAGVLISNQWAEFAKKRAEKK